MNKLFVYCGICLGHVWDRNVCFGTFWGMVWDTITHTNFAELRMILFFNVLNTLEKASALGRSLVIFK
ncbi:hypothetical protein ACR0H5_005031, partial [Escherichia coli H20]